MKKSSIDEIRHLLETENNFLIFTHENPDGDALGSTAAMLAMLLEKGKKAKLLIPEKLPAKYQKIIKTGNIINSIGQDELNSEYKYCLSIDLPRSEKAALGNSLKIADIKIPLINIDHHVDNPSFGSMNLIVSEAAAAAEIVFNIFEGMPEWKISPDAATYMMLGIVMDTGCFRFHNTSPEAFEISSKLKRLGARHIDIINQMYFERPLDMIKLEADIVLNHVNFDCEGLFAWAYLSEELLGEHNTDIKNVEGLIDLLRAMEGTEIVALVSKRGNAFKFSLRSKNSKYKVGKIARAMGGGGHDLAAAGYIENVPGIEEAGKILVQKVKDLLNE